MCISNSLIDTHKVNILGIPDLKPDCQELLRSHSTAFSRSYVLPFPHPATRVAILIVDTLDKLCQLQSFLRVESHCLSCVGLLCTVPHTAVLVVLSLSLSCGIPSDHCPEIIMSILPLMGIWYEQFPVFS